MTLATLAKRVTSIRIEGFRSLKSIELRPTERNVLIGANGVGKSNLLSALRMITLMRTGAFRRFVATAGGASSLLHFGPSTTREIQLRIEFQQETGANFWDARLGYAAQDTLVFLDERVGYQAPGTVGFQELNLGAGHAESKVSEAASSNPTAKAVDWWLGQLDFFHFHDTSPTAPLRQNGRQDDTRYLRSDGSNLASFLYRLKTEESDEARAAWKRIGMLVRRVAPFLLQLEPELVAPEQKERSAVRLMWQDDRGSRFGVHQLSDGTLRAIALITALQQPEDGLPVLLTIDEPELGLHPAALHLLTSLLHSVSSRRQVVVATQSPALLDDFSAEDVVVAERADGCTSFERLKADALAAWLDEYSLSEVYAKNVFGGRP